MIERKEVVERAAEEAWEVKKEKRKEDKEQLMEKK